MLKKTKDTVISGQETIYIMNWHFNIRGVTEGHIVVNALVK